jgi:hypothetical protein
VFRASQTSDYLLLTIVHQDERDIDENTLDTVAAVAMAVTALITAPAAVANTEAQFLDELNTDGATLPGKTPSEMVAADCATCEHLRVGTSVLDEMNAVNHTYRFNQGTIFVSGATTNLCPNFAAEQNSHAQGH